MADNFQQKNILDGIAEFVEKFPQFRRELEEYVNKKKPDLCVNWVVFEDEEFEELILDNMKREKIISHTCKKVWKAKTKLLKRLDGNAEHVSSLNGIKLFRNLEVIDIRESNISDIAELSELLYLKELTLRNSKVDKIPLVPSLTRIDMADNKLEDLNGVERCVDLQYLDLSNNSVEYLTELWGLKKLNFVNMKNNNVVDYMSLIDCDKLRSLYIQGNPCIDYTPLEDIYAKLDSKDFKIVVPAPVPNQSLTVEFKDVNLGKLLMSEVQKFQCNDSGTQGQRKQLTLLEKLAKINSLTISQSNEVYSLDDLVYCKGLRKLIISESTLDSFIGITELANLTILHINGCNLRRCPALPISVKKLSLKCNELRGKLNLKYLTSLETLDVSDNRMLHGVELPNSVLNIKVSNTSIESFKGFPTGVRTLIAESIGVTSAYDFKTNISRKMSKLSSNLYVEDIKRFTELEVLDISDNEISSIRSLGSLNNLADLDVNSNHVKNIKVFKNMCSLRRLDLRSNDIADFKSLKYLNKLNVLLLQGNPAVEADTTMTRRYFNKLTEKDFDLHKKDIRGDNKYVGYEEGRQRSMDNWNKAKIAAKIFMFTGWAAERLTKAVQNAVGIANGSVTKGSNKRPRF